MPAKMAFSVETGVSVCAEAAKAVRQGFSSGDVEGGEVYVGMREGSRLKELIIDSLKVGSRHRKDMGDLPTLAENMRREDPLQPIGVNDSNSPRMKSDRVIRHYFPTLSAPCQNARPASVSVSAINHSTRAMAAFEIMSAGGFAFQFS